MNFREIGRYLTEREGQQIVVKVYPPVGDLERFKVNQKNKKPKKFNEEKSLRDVNPLEFMNWNDDALYC